MRAGGSRPPQCGQDVIPLPVLRIAGAASEDGAVAGRSGLARGLRSGYGDPRADGLQLLGLRQKAAFSSPGGRVTLLDAGQATIELADPPHAAYVDEVEVGRPVAGHIRVAFEVADAVSMTTRLATAGARVLAEPIETPWRSLDSRSEGAAGLQSTLFAALEPE